MELERSPRVVFGPAGPRIDPLPVLNLYTVPKPTWFAVTGCLHGHSREALSKKCIEGLSDLVRHQSQEDPLSSYVFVVSNRRQNKTAEGGCWAMRLSAKRRVAHHSGATAHKVRFSFQRNRCRSGHFQAERPLPEVLLPPRPWPDRPTRRPCKNTPSSRTRISPPPSRLCLV